MKQTIRPVQKALLLRQIVAALTERLEVLEKAAQASHAEATHESSKAENKYDTRGLEAAYLAGGQARQARELLEAIKTYAAFTARDFGADDSIDLGALVAVAADGVESWYFLGPKNGGLEVGHEGREVMVITPQSPLGGQITGRRAGHKWTVKAPGTTVRQEITQVF